MKEFIDQAGHNQKFHDCIVENFAEDFFDWKITVTFYTALHYLKALASKKGAFIGNSHSEMLQSVNPNKKNFAVMPLSYTAWNAYKALYGYCHAARYDGITDFETWRKLKEADYAHSQLLMKDFEKYCVEQGIELKNPTTKQKSD